MPSRSERIVVPDCRCHWFRAALACAAACATLGAVKGAHADRVPIGGRTATMGGAGVAAGNDSAMPYLNPAGLAGVPGSIFGVSATVYAYQRLDVERYFFPAPMDASLGYGEISVGRDTVASSTFMDLPSSVMYFEKRRSAEGRLV